METCFMSKCWLLHLYQKLLLLSCALIFPDPICRAVRKEDETCRRKQIYYTQDWLLNGCAVTHVSTTFRINHFIWLRVAKFQSLNTVFQLSSDHDCSLLNTALSVRPYAVLEYSNPSFQSDVCFTPMLKCLSCLCYYVTTAPPSEAVKQNIVLNITPLCLTLGYRPSTTLYIVMGFHNYMVKTVRYTLCHDIELDVLLNWVMFGYKIYPVTNSWFTTHVGAT